MAAHTRTRHDEYRILTKLVGDHEYRWMAFSGAGPSRDLDAIETRIVKAREESPPGWKFRIQVRTVVIEASEWQWAAR